jgi:outer membrane protein
MQKNLRAIIQQAVNTIGQQRGYAFILNTDKEVLTFINPAIGEDITLVVKELLEER